MTFEAQILREEMNMNGEEGFFLTEVKVEADNIESARQTLENQNLDVIEIREI